MMKGRSIALIVGALVVLWFGGMAVFVLRTPQLKGWRDHQKSRLKAMLTSKSASIEAMSSEIKTMKSMLEGQSRILRNMTLELQRGMQEERTIRSELIAMKGNIEYERETAHRLQRNSRKTIFLSIASYRDQECNHTLMSALENAAYPAALSAGIVQQNNMTVDDDCLDTYCAQSQLCRDMRRRGQLRIMRVPNEDAKGPTVARSWAESLLKDEDFYLQVDSHTHFAPHWDIKMLEDWEATQNEYAILTVYPMPYGADPDLLPHVCQARFSGDAADQGFPQFKSYIIPKVTKPQLQPFWAAGFSFSRSHATKRVPYDPHTAYLFHGEEFSRGARLWTHGYDFYSPSENFVLHHYGRKVRRPDTEGGERWNRGYKVLQKSGQRVKLVLHMQLDPKKPKEFDKDELEKYGLGKQRSWEQYLQFAGINLEKKKCEPRCHLTEKDLVKMTPLVPT